MRRFPCQGSVCRIGYRAICWLVATLIVCGNSAFAQLANPAEREFAESLEAALEQSNRLSRGAVSRGAAFVDDTLPSQKSVPKIEPKSRGNRAIQQVSGDAETSQTVQNDVWDSVRTGNGGVSKGMTLADWGVTPSELAHHSPPPTPPWNAEPSAPTGWAASDLGQSYSAQQYLAQQYLSQQYGTQQPFVPQTIDPPFGQYGGMYADSMYGGNMVDPYGMMASNPWSYQTPYQTPGQQQLALYQAMLQQEMIRREVAQEVAQEEADATQQEELRKKAEDEGLSPLKNSTQWNMRQLMPVHVSSPLGTTLLSCAKTLSPFSSPKGPHRGVGQPLEVRSWLDRPCYFGGFTGWVSGSELVSGLVDQKHGAMGGLILGYNLSEYWGVEGRVHFASIDIQETARGRQEFSNWYQAMFPDDPVVPSLTTRSNQLSVFDVSVHYYPLGNAKWRPFFKYGLGLARESFVDTYGQKRRSDTMTMPFGVGLRYWWDENLAIQLDLVDNVVFSSGITKTQNNIAFCVGLTYSFGSSKKKRPTAYWPYTPSHGSKY